MLYELRDYQQELIEKIFGAWSNGDRKVLAQLATGAGKTVIFAHLARSFVQQGQRVLVVAHRTELITQAREKLEEISGLEVGVIKSGFPNEAHKDIQVASIQTISRRKHRPLADLVIYDEAHRTCSKSASDLLKCYSKAYHLGVTATPCRSDGQGFKWLFDRLVIGAEPADLMRRGYLSTFRLFGAKQISTTNIKSIGGDYNQEQLEKSAMKVIADVLPTWHKHAQGKRTILFAVSIKHSNEMVKLFQEAQIAAEHLDSETPTKERERILERFRTGETVVLSNVSILTEGTDLPFVECVQCVRPTQSLVLWLQMVGRGLRPSQDKDYCIIIDHSENWLKHGLPDEPREWSLNPVSLPAKIFAQKCGRCAHIFIPLSHEQNKPIHTIQNAKGQIWTTHKTTCPNCLNSFEYKQCTGGSGGDRSSSQAFGEILEVGVDCTPQGLAVFKSLLAEQEATGKAKGWVYYRALEHVEVANFSVGDWRFLADSLGYSISWAHKAWQAIYRNQGESPCTILENPDSSNSFC